MVIKRNRNYKNNSGSHMLRKNGKGKYVFPTYPEIPAETYFSKIMDAKYTTTKTGKEAVEVFYKFKNAATCYRVVNGTLPEDTNIETYYIKQVYPVGSQYYEDFVDSVADCLGIEDEAFGIEDIKGVTELVSLAYDKSTIGGINERKPFKEEDFIAVNTQGDEYEQDDDYIQYDEYAQYDEY